MLNLWVKRVTGVGLAGFVVFAPYYQLHAPPRIYLCVAILLVVAAALVTTRD